MKEVAAVVENLWQRAAQAMPSLRLYGDHSSALWPCKSPTRSMPAGSPKPATVEKMAAGCRSS
jgi:hypothetical protein